MMEKLRKRLKELHWSAAALERAAGLPQNRISKWAGGQGEPSLSQAVAIARHLKLPLAYLADDALEDPAPGLSEAQEKLLWAARTIGYDLALRRVLAAPEAAATVPMPRGPEEVGNKTRVTRAESDPAQRHG